MSLKIYSSNLKYLMNLKKLDREKLAGHMRIKPGRIAPWLAGRSYPRIDQMIDLCNALEYFDLYRLHTVDLKKHPEKIERKLSANVSIALKNIINEANDALSI